MTLDKAQQSPGHSPMSSPLRSSPLAKPPIYATRRAPSTTTSSTSEARAIPRRASQSNRSRAGIASLGPATSPEASASAMPVPTSSPPLSRSHPLLGSYSLSLIHSRMSHAHQPHSSSSTFSIHIKAVGKGKGCPPELRCPKPLDLPFPATYYDLEGSSTSGRSGANQTPWVGTVDLEQHYYDQYQYAPLSVQSPMPTTTMMDPPDHPGYPVAPVGQLQMVVKTPTSALKAFLVPYDLRGLPVGGRLLARERTYGQSTSPSNPSSPDPSSASPGDTSHQKRSLRYAYQLQFVCLPVPLSSRSHPAPGNGARARDSSTSRPTSASAFASTSDSPRDAGPSVEKAYYLSKTIKIIFTAKSPELDESLRTERTDEVVPPSAGIRVSGDGVKQRRRSSVFGASSPGKILEDWELVRLKWLARRDMSEIHQSGTDVEGSDTRKQESGETVPPSGPPSRVARSTDLDRAAANPESRVEKDAIACLPPLKPPSRAPTPIPQPFNLPHAPQVVKPPPSPRFARRQLRRTSVEERELSEKLRKGGLE